jgi:hypothetical protein
MFNSKVENYSKIFINSENLPKPVFESLILKYIEKEDTNNQKKIQRTYSIQKRFLRFEKKNIFISDFLSLLYDSLNFKFRIKFDVSIRKNNIFCTEIDIYKNQFLLRSSSGKYHLHSSKKKLKYSSKRTMEFLFSVIRNTYSYSLKKNKKIPYYRHTILNLSAPIRFRYKIVKRILTFFKKKRFNVINLKLKKCFNGCRALKRNHKKPFFKQIFK